MSSIGYRAFLEGPCIHTQAKPPEKSLRQGSQNANYSYPARIVEGSPQRSFFGDSSFVFGLNFGSLLFVNLMLGLFFKRGRFKLLDEGSWLWPGGFTRVTVWGSGFGFCLRFHRFWPLWVHRFGKFRASAP